MREVQEVTVDIRGSALTETERRGFEEVQAAQDEGRLCLVRSMLDGRERAAVCSVLSGDDGTLVVVPLALLVTDDEAGRIVDPDGRPTTERALGDLLEAGNV
jgi:hypothetical protein